MYEVWLDWHELSTEKGVDPMDNFALVESEHRIVGWIGFDMLDANNDLSNCMEPIESNMIITSDTPLIEVVSAFYVTRQPFFIVLQETRFIGWVSRKVLNGPTLCLCLLALILEIERLLLQVLKVNPDDSCAILSPKRYEVALKIHSCKGYRLSPEGCPYSAELLECTALSDRIAVVALNENYSDSIPSITNRYFCRRLKTLRNEIAHPKSEEQLYPLLSVEELWPFIKWAETLEAELRNYLLKTQMRDTM